MAQGITRRGPGQYLVRVRRRGVVINRTFDTFAAAERFRDVTIGELSGDTYVDRTREQATTLRQLLERYLTEVTPTKKGAQQEADRIRAWMREDFASLPVVSIQPPHIVEWRDRRQAEGVAPTTISNPLNILSAVFRLAIFEWGLRLTNPCVGVRRPRAGEPRNAYLTKEQEGHLLAVCRRGPPWLEFAVRLAIETGMRQSEIWRIEWKHIHRSHIHLPVTKNGTKRDVPLTEGALAVVDEMRDALFAEGARHVFGTNSPQHMIVNQFRKAVATAVENHGIPHVTFHDLRHVAITRLRYVHVDALDLAQTTGHKTIAVLRRYDNERAEVRADLIRARERALLNS